MKNYDNFHWGKKKVKLYRDKNQDNFNLGEKKENIYCDESCPTKVVFFPPKRKWLKFF